MRITCSECVFVALVFQHTTCIRRIVMCELPGSTIVFFSNYLINGTVFGKTSYWTQNVFWFSIQISSQTFLILKRNERDIIKNVYWSVCKMSRYSCQILRKLVFSRLDLAKYSKIKFHENLGYCNAPGQLLALFCLEKFLREIVQRRALSATSPTSLTDEEI
jgi:hypothetical protein